MGTYEDRVAQWQSEQSKYFADAIRKDYAGQFDMSGMSDDDIIRGHHAEFANDMDHDAYGKALVAAYGTGPEQPKRTLGESAQAYGAAVKEAVPGVLTGLIPYAVQPATEIGLGAAGKLAAAKAVGARAPVAGMIGALAGHAANAVVDEGMKLAMLQTERSLGDADMTQDYFKKLRSSPNLKEYSDEQLLEEARRRAQNITRGREMTRESIENEQIAPTEADILAEPGRALMEAYFMTLAGPIHGALEKAGLKLGGAGLMGAAGRVAANAARGVGVAAPGLVGERVVNQAIASAAQNKTPAQIAQDLGRAAWAGMKESLIGGGIFGAGMGLLGEAARPVREAAAKIEERARIAADELDDARLRGWRERRAAEKPSAPTPGTPAPEGRTGAMTFKPGTTIPVEGTGEEKWLRDWREKNAAMGKAAEESASQARKAALADAVKSFDPTNSAIPLSGNHAADALALIEQKFGPNMVNTEDGMRAAAELEQRLKLHNAANDALVNYNARELPGAPAPQPERLAGAPPQAPVSPEPNAVSLPGPTPQQFERPTGVRRLPLQAPEPAAAPVAPEQLTEANVSPLPRSAVVSPKVAAVAPKESNAIAPVPASEFQPAVAAAEAEHPQAKGSLTVHPPEYYAQPGVETYMSPDKKSGFALTPRPQGGKELVSVFNVGEKGGGAKATQMAVERGATDLDAIKPLEKFYARFGFKTVRSERNYVAGQPDVVFMEHPANIAKLPPEQRLAREVGPHFNVTTEGGRLNLERAAVEGAQIGESTKALDDVVKRADELNVPVSLRIAKFAANKGRIPVEKQIEFFKKQGFEVESSTRAPEGEMTTATLVRKPIAAIQAAGRTAGLEPDAARLAAGNVEPGQKLASGSLAEQLELSLGQAAEKAKKRIAARSKKLGGLQEGLTGAPRLAAMGAAEIADHGIVLAAEMFSRGMRLKEEVSDWLLKTYGDRIKPYIDRIFASAQKRLTAMFQSEKGTRDALVTLMQNAEHGRHGKDWYEETSKWVHQHFVDPGDADMFLKFLAVTSADATVESGVTFALRAFGQWKEGLPFDRMRYGDIADKLEQAVRGEQWKGNKIWNFYKALAGDPNAVVLDRHMIRVLGLPKKLTDKTYELYSQIVRRLAEKAGMTPRQFQAAVWEGSRIGQIHEREAAGGRRAAAKMGSARPPEWLAAQKLGGLTPYEWVAKNRAELQRIAAEARTKKGK